MKTLGILGGVGPQTTAKVYLSVIDSIKKAGSEKYPPIVIYNLPFASVIEDEAIVQGINSEKMIPYLIEGAKVLEKAGADYGILPCNTLHKYIDEVRRAVKIPFLSIIDEVVIALKKNGVANIGILATETTVRCKLFDEPLAKNRIRVVYPSLNEQNTINDTIVELLNDIRNDQQTEKINKICVALFERGADAILLACTDLQLITTNIELAIPLIDTTEILINASVREMI